MNFGAQERCLSWIYGLLWYIGNIWAYKKLWLSECQTMLLLIGNSLLAHYWERIKLLTLLTSGLAVWLSLGYELWSDVPFMRISFKKDLVAHYLSLCYEMGVFQVGTTPLVNNMLSQVSVLTYKRHTTWVRNKLLL